MINREVIDMFSFPARNPARRGRIIRAACAFGAALFALSAMGALPALGETPPAPLCFDGPANHTYADGKMWINIQMRSTEGPEPITYFVCDIQVTDPGALKTALSGDAPRGPREATADIAERYGAKLAINGDAYGFHDKAIIVRNGTILRARRTSIYHLLMLDGAGDLTAVPDNGTGDGTEFAAELLERGATQVWAFGPVLVQDGAAMPLDDFRLIKVHAREPRTAIGQIGPLHYVAVVADGRSKNHSVGLTLPELQQVFLIARAKIAFNLDGGGSSTLYFCGEVLNKPAGGVERSVSDILFF